MNPLVRRKARRIQSYLRLVDVGGDIRSTILVVGSARSGTTWVGSVISTMMRSRQIFEPFVVNENQDLAVLGDLYFDYSWLQKSRVLYIDRNADRRSQYFNPIDKVLRGKFRNKRTDSDLTGRIYRNRVIKAIRANLILPYIASTWPEIKIVWIVRDALSVINSQIAMAKHHGWSFDRDYEIVTGVGGIDAWLSDALAEIEKVSTLPEKLAHRWCIETMFPFQTGVHQLPSTSLVTYDNLVDDIESWQPISQLVAGKVWSGERFSALVKQPSATSRSRVQQGS